MHSSAKVRRELPLRDGEKFDVFSKLVMATPQPTLPRTTGDLAAELRSFRPLGLVAMAAVFLSGNVFVGNYAGANNIPARRAVQH